MPRSAGLPGLDEPQGHGYGTAPMASFFRTLKSELVHCRRFATGAGHGAVFARIDGFSNRTHRYATIGYISPTEMELKAA